MAKASVIPTDLVEATQGIELNFALPDPADEQIPEYEFHQQIDQAWQVCDRFDLQTDIWRAGSCAPCGTAKSAWEKIGARAF
jgi:hypothetical protein